MIKFSIITPTIQRQSLIDCCSSVDSQTYTNWEHLVRIDRAPVDTALISKLQHLQRYISKCDQPHFNGGNTCRVEALRMAEGDYCYFLDCDNILADPDVLTDMAQALEQAARPAWGLFPIWRLGGRFFSDPPRSCHVDTMNVVLRRDIAYWPDTDAYGTDGILVDDLMERHVPYVAYPDFRPIGIISRISFCK